MNTYVTKNLLEPTLEGTAKCQQESRHRLYQLLCIAPPALGINRPSFAYEVLCIFIVILNCGRASFMVNTLLLDEYCWRWSKTMIERWSRINSHVLHKIGPYTNRSASMIWATPLETKVVPDPSLSTCVITYFLHKCYSSSFIETIFLRCTESSVELTRIKLLDTNLQFLFRSFDIFVSESCRIC